MILLLVGGLVIPVFGWVIGVVLLWASDAWNVRDKVIGTLLVPGGLGLPFFLMFSSLQEETISCPQPVTGMTITSCDTSGSANYLGLAGLIVLILIPLFTTGYLAHRLRHHPAAATA